MTCPSLFLSSVRIVRGPRSGTSRAGRRLLKGLRHSVPASAGPRLSFEPRRAAPADVGCKAVTCGERLHPAILPAVHAAVTGQARGICA